MIKIATILGARPQFIKSKPLSDLFAKDSEIEEVVIHTGQHYDFAMYKTFLNELKLRSPDYYLGIQGGTNIQQITRMMLSLEEVFHKENPDLILVYGDTNSTLAGALCGKLLHRPICHIEAGLRSNNWIIAEEVIRVLTDRISNLLFTPTKEADENLKKEGNTNNVFNVGDIMYDVLNSHVGAIQVAYERVAQDLKLEKGTNFIFMTLHRAELVDDENKLRDVIKILGEIDVLKIFSIHPRTKKNMDSFKIKLPHNIRPIKPTPYLATLGLIKNSIAVITDSGGIQREAYMLKKKCYTLRDETEWTETLENQCNTLLSTNPATIKKRLESLKQVKDKLMFKDIFGDGTTSIKIYNQIKTYFSP